jgi:hypothetical protein
MKDTEIQTTHDPIEDAVNAMIYMGISKGRILGRVLRMARHLLGNVGVALIDGEGDGNLTGIIMGNPLLIETNAELCTAEGWELSTMDADPDDDAAPGNMN